MAMALRIKAKTLPLQPPVTPQPASKHFDIVLGLDFHFLKIPWPVTPCPVTPFAALVFDPLDYIHLNLPVMPVYSEATGFTLAKNIPMGGTVTINGCYRAAATTGLLALPPLSVPVPGKLRAMGEPGKKFNPLHAVIPKALFVVPPLAPHDGEISHGSKTVATAGSEQSALFCAAFSCTDAGRIVLNMPTGFFNNYATAIIAVLPFGKPVKVGGPFVEHAFNMADLVNALMVMGIMKGAGKLLTKTLGKLLTKMNRALMERFPAYRAHGEALQPHLCHYLGEPVDAASGHMSSRLQGFNLPGPIPFEWAIHYYSDSLYDGPMGKNLYHSYDITLHAVKETAMLLLRDQYGCAIPFPALQPGQHFFNPRDKYTLHRLHDGEYIIATREGLTYAFNHFADSGGFHKLRAISNCNGFAIRFNYDGQGRLVKMIDSAHREIMVTNDANGRITALQVPHPELPGDRVTLSRYYYDEQGRMVQWYDARDHHNSLQWTNRLITARTFKDGTTFHFRYNNQQQCVAAVGPDGLYSYYFAYHQGHTIVTNSLGYRTTYYHHHRLVNRVVNSQGEEKLYRYDGFRNLLAVQDELGRVTNYTYDERGNTTGIGLPGQGTVNIMYNSNDQPVQVARPNGGVWQYEYDEPGNLTRQTNAEGGVTRYEYQGGLLSQVTNAAGYNTRLLYNRQYQLSQVILPNNTRIRYTHDALGRCTQVEDIQGNHQLRSYDLNNNLLEVKEADGNIRRLQYDAMDNLVHAADRLSRVEIGYNFFGDVVHRKQGDATLRFVYNTEGRLVSVQNAHNERYQFVQDSEGRVIRETGFDGITRQYHRDSAGQVIKIELAANHSTRLEYDSAGNIVLVQYSDNSTETFEYDSNCNLVKAANNETSVQLRRDLLGRVTEETSTLPDGQAVTIRQQLDAAGKCLELTSSRGAQVTYRYNNMDAVTTMEAGGWQSTIQYDDTGAEITRSITGGLQLQWRHDRFGRPLEQQVLQHHTTKRRRTYNWGMDDRLLAITDSKTGAVQFKHDVYGNLAELIYSNGNSEYRFPDAAGNLFETPKREDRKYGAGGRLLQSAKHTYQYDAAGNLAGKTAAGGATWRYYWNRNGTLQKVVRPDNQEVCFGYDALGRRTWKSFKQTITRWVWNGDTPLHEWKEFNARESSADELITWVFETGSFVPAAKLKGDKKYSIIADHLGTPKEMYQEDGTCCWQGELDGYGRLRLLQGDAGSCPFRYQGQYEDVETGLYYNRFRYYSPEEGIYISQDPIGLAGGNPTLYGYVKDPNSWVDQLGLSGCKNSGISKEESFANDILNPKEIHFMQSSIKNQTGEFTVLGNANALKNGSLDPTILRMNVWRDKSGKIWTLDHRRLGAFRLSGLNEAPVKWSDPTSDLWKMTTKNGGTSIWLKLGNGNGITIR